MLTDVGLVTSLFIGGVVLFDAARTLLKPNKASNGFSDIFEALGVIDKEKKNETIKYYGMRQNNNYIILAFGLSENLTSDKFQKNRGAIMEKLGIDNLEISAKKDAMYFKIRKSNPPAIDYRYIQAKNNHLIPIGYDEDFKVVYWDINIDPHLLMAGATASGKTVALHNMINYIIRSGYFDLYLSDMKGGVDFNVYGLGKNLIGLNRYANTKRDTEQMIRDFKTESNKRKDLLTRSGYENYNELCKHTRQIPFKPLIMVIDEFPDLVPFSKSKDDVDYIEMLVDEARKCRAWGMHIVLSAQRPDATIVKGRLKNNFTGRLGFRMGSATDSRIILNKNGCENLKVGQCIARFGGVDTLTRTALIKRDDINSLVEEYNYPTLEEIIDQAEADNITKPQGLIEHNVSVNVNEVFTDDFLKGAR